MLTASESIAGLRLERLSDANFHDYELLTGCQRHGGCYCAFWHEKCASQAEWVQRQKESPETNRELVRLKMRTGFHPGVLAYDGADLVAWISVAPLPEFHWTWRRVAELGESAGNVAGITCITVAPEHRGKGRAVPLLKALGAYGREKGWSAIEGYPFDDEALAKHGNAIAWPGVTRHFVEAGFQRTGPHWLSQGEYPRSVLRLALS